MACREFYTCRDCGRIFYDGCLTCGWAHREQKIVCPNCGSVEKPQKKKYFICPTLLANMGTFPDRVPVIRD
ncbi:MAG: hypothetical protein K2M91_06950, partial [Lachnospiraceae bacterium]|nr:hypothetical protein [Lachnospiraceae bacterium]